jgi:NAD-dependent deacetylase
MPKLVILTGAGLSAESGVATFRDSNGLWENHRIEDVCYIETWRRNFDLVHKFYNARRMQLGSVEPNAAHRMIAEWEKRYDTVAFTQNVDDLLERGGSKTVVHLHGFLPELRCLNCGMIWNIGYTEWNPHASCPTPHCRDRGIVKPNIVFFGEQAPQYMGMWDTFGSMTKQDVLLILGTSGVVLPVSDIAAAHPGPTILNNLHREPSIPDHSFDHVFYEPATQAVQKIDDLLKELLGDGQA